MKTIGIHPNIIGYVEYAPRFMEKKIIVELPYLALEKASNSSLLGYINFKRSLKIGEGDEKWTRLWFQ